MVVAKQKIEDDMWSLFYDYIVFHVITSTSSNVSS